MIQCPKQVLASYLKSLLELHLLYVAVVVLVKNVKSLLDLEGLFTVVL